jgi:hypothetical protein
MCRLLEWVEAASPTLHYMCVDVHGAGGSRIQQLDRLNSRGAFVLSNSYKSELTGWKDPTYHGNLGIHVVECEFDDIVLACNYGHRVH